MVNNSPVFFLNGSKKFPEMHWYYYQGASPAPMCIVWHKTLTKKPTS